MTVATTRRNVSVVGATGFVGRRLVDFLLENRPDVRLSVLTRGSERPLGHKHSGRVDVVRGDLLKAGSFEDMLSAAGTVVNLAFLAGGTLADNLQAAQNLGQACKTRCIKRLVHLSSVAVYGEGPQTNLDEESPCHPQTHYQKIKYQVENRLREIARGNFQLVILRPAVIFGPHGRNLIKLANDLRYGFRIINYLKACLFANRRMNLVALENVVTATDFLMECELPSDQELFIVSDDDLRENFYRSVEKQMLQGLGLGGYPLPVIPLPLFMAAGVLKFLKRSAANPGRCYRNCKLTRLGYKRAVGLDEGLSEFTNWYKRHLF